VGGTVCLSIDAQMHCFNREIEYLSLPGNAGNPMMQFEEAQFLLLHLIDNSDTIIIHLTIVIMGFVLPSPSSRHSSLLGSQQPKPIGLPKGCPKESDNERAMKDLHLPPKAGFIASLSLGLGL